MPTYGYECLSCDNQFEIFQSIKDDALTKCDVCGGALRKRIYPVGIAFKGSGFYVNDYAPKSSSHSAPAADAPKSDAGGEAKSDAPKADSATTEGKSEAKTEIKAEPKTPAAASA